MDVFVNEARWSDELGQELADGLGSADIRVRPCDPADLPSLVRAVARRGDPVVGVAGGDGTIRCAAGALADSTTALLPVPAGTLNHFARAVGIDTAAAAGQAAARGRVTCTDLAEVNGQVFCNNATSGWYPAMVTTRDRWAERMPKRLATALAAARHLGTVPALHIDIDASRISRTWMLWVGAGEYGTTPATLTERESLASGCLDVRVLDRDATLPRVRAIWHLARHQLDESEIVDRLLVPSLVVRTRSRRVSVGLDGDVVSLRPPLRFRLRPGALRVIDGRDEAVAAEGLDPPPQG